MLVRVLVGITAVLVGVLVRVLVLVGAGVLVRVAVLVGTEQLEISTDKL